MTKTSDDFDPQKAVEELSANFHQPDKFAEKFCQVARTQKSVDVVLKEIFKNLIKEDPDTINTLKAYQRQIDQEDWRFFLKKIGYAGSATFWLIMGSILTAIIGITVKKYF